MKKKKRLRRVPEGSAEMTFHVRHAERVRRIMRQRSKREGSREQQA